MKRIIASETSLMLRQLRNSWRSRFYEYFCLQCISISYRGILSRKFLKRSWSELRYAL